MKTSAARFLVLPLTAAVLLSGCARVSMGTLGTVTTRPMTPEELAGPERKGYFKGESTSGIFLFIPMGHPNIEEAVDRALEAGGGNYLRNANVHYHFWWLPFIWGEETITVEGEVY